MKVSIPLACTPYLEEQSLKRLEELGVFGFAKTPSANRGESVGTLSGNKP